MATTPTAAGGAGTGAGVGVGSAVRGLKGIAIFEKDINADILCWNFPAIEKSQQEILKGRCGLSDIDIEYGFRFSKLSSDWQYFYTLALPAVANKVTAISIVILSTNYNPMKYEAALTLLSKIYLAPLTSALAAAANAAAAAAAVQTIALSPVPVLQSYLAFFTNGKFTSTFGNFDETQFDDRKALLSSIKNILNYFGVESVLIWTAMLMKKRIFVFHSSSSSSADGSDSRISELINFIRSLPLFGAWHRQDFALLRPFIRLDSENELSDLLNIGIYIAGTTDSSIQNRKDLYDLLIDLSSRTLSISENAKNDFLLTKYHKSSVELFVKAAETESDQGMIKVVAQRTKELLEQIASLRIADEKESGKSYITAEHLAKQKLPTNMDKFIYSVALAEGMAKK